MDGGVISPTYASNQDEKNLDDGDEDTEGQFRQFKRWYRADLEHWSEWREETDESYKLVAGDQWSEDDKRALKDQMRPIVTFNRIAPTIESVVGLEIGNRREVQYIPRTMGDVQGDEVLTAASEWVRDQCDAEDEESDAFFDTVVCGMGWTETRMDYEENPDGDIVISRIDPKEMLSDKDSIKRNLKDARRLWRVRTMPISDARALCPGHDDEDLDASWARGDDVKKPHHADKELAYNQGTQLGDDDNDEVTLVQVQWWEKEPYHRISLNGQQKDVSPDELKGLDDKFDMASKMTGQPAPKYAKANLTRKVYKQAFIGAKVLEVEDSACPGHFTWQCVTGKRDKNKGTWYGLVRCMKDPQLWANKWLSQTMHIMNTNAKGGIMAERTAFENTRDAEQSWAKSERITWLAEGGAAKISNKPQPTFPAGFENLMEFALTSIRDVSGVSQELIGLADRNQPGVLEDQRKQAGMTILAILFDSLRAYRKRQGRVQLYFIQTYISDGRLIRVVGAENAQYLPLIRRPDYVEYDVIVDDAPTSPNQKEKIWGIIKALLPTIAPMLDPQTMLSLAKYSPLPSSVVKELSDTLQQKQAQQAPIQQATQQMAVEKHQADVQKTTAQAQRDQADAARTMSEIGHPAAPPQVPPSQPGDFGVAITTALKNQAQARAADAQAAKNNAAADTQQVRTAIAIRELNAPFKIQ